MKRILLYGNFGDHNNPATDGQTSKTRNFYKIIKQFGLSDTRISTFNTKGFKRRPISYFLRLKKSINDSDIIIIFPGSIRNLNVFRKAYGNSKKVVLYPIVGGWLGDKICKKPRLIDFLNKFVGIYPETTGLKEQLKTLGVTTNITIIPTFTLRDSLPFDAIIELYRKRKTANLISCFYFGRITFEKGINLAIDAIKELNLEHKDIRFTLDIYGKLSKDININNLESLLDNNIRYNGVLDDREFKRISQYDFFLFPTFYHGEGFPACCVEAFHYGTPVIASNWKYNSEIIIDGKNGFLFETKNKESLKSTIIAAASSDIEAMKRNAYEYGQKFNYKSLIEPFYKDLLKLYE